MPYQIELLMYRGVIGLAVKSNKAIELQNNPCFSKTEE